MTTPRGALLTAGVNYDDAEKTMRTVAEILGAHVGWIPDGEVGKRFHWIMFQPDVLGEADGIERVGAESIPFGAGLEARPLRIADGSRPPRSRCRRSATRTRPTSPTPCPPASGPRA